MKRIVTLVFVLILSACTGLKSPEQTGVAVGKLLNQVQIAIDEISKSSESSSLPPLKKAEITVSTEYARSAVGGATVFLSAKGEKSTTDNSSLTLTLEPNPSSEKPLDTGIGQNIAKYVLAAVEAVEKQKSLKLSKLNVEVGLEIVQTAEGGIEIEISGVSIEGKKTNSSTSGHKLTLLFEE